MEEPEAALPPPTSAPAASSPDLTVNIEDLEEGEWEVAQKKARSPAKNPHEQPESSRTRKKNWVDSDTLREHGIYFYFTNFSATWTQTEMRAAIGDLGKRDLLQMCTKCSTTQTEALVALQESAKNYIVQLFEEAMLCAFHAKRVTLSEVADPFCNSSSEASNSSQLYIY